MDKFLVLDYIVCAGTVVASGMIGLWYAVWTKRDSDDPTATYLLGNRRMPLVPVILSLVATFISGATLLGSTAEGYLYGTGYVFMFLFQFVNGLIASYVTLPVYYEMELTSVNEYLERRYDRRMRLIGPTFKLIRMTVQSTVTLQLAAVSFQQVSGVNSHIGAAAAAVLCSAYTIAGGFKALIWADAVQSMILLAGLIALVVKGTADVGGFDVLWDRNSKSGRLDFPSFQPDEFTRHSFWSLIIGGTAAVAPMFASAADSVQRFTSLSTLVQARKAVWWYVAGITCFSVIFCYIGMLLYATYHDCDPLATSQVESPDQLLVQLVMRVLGDYPGLPGLFIAAVFSASISTFSTHLNTSALLVLEDFVKPFRSQNLTSRTVAMTMRVVVSIAALLSFGLVFAAERVGIPMFEFTLSFLSLIDGPNLGLFVGGMLLPWMSALGVRCGVITTIFFTGTIIVEANIHKTLIRPPFKPMSTDGCDPFFNASAVLVSPPSQEDSYVFPLFKISYLWYTFFGVIMTVTLGMIISFFTGLTDLSKLDPKLVAPVSRRFLPEPKEEEERVPMTDKYCKPAKENAAALISH